MKTTIVKYCCERDWARNKAGAFKIGTLEDYRTSELDASRMTDRREGIQSTSIGGQSGTITNLNLAGGGSIQNCSWEGCAHGFREIRAYNDYVFCATLGPYDPKHHELMLNGDGETYEGNPDLTHFVEIDHAKFLRAVSRWAKNKKGVMRNGHDAPHFFYAPITYEDRDINRELEEALRTTPEEANTIAITRATFHKPTHFAPEKEHRTVVRTNGNYLGAELGAKSLFPSSPFLRRAILRSS